MEQGKEYKNRIIAERKKKKGQSKSMMACLMVCVIMASLCFGLAACETSGARSEVSNDLNAIKTSTSASGQLESLREMVSGDTSSNIDEFLSKVRDFDYEIISEEDSGEGDGKTVSVKVRIKTYDFGSEYLAAMKDYIKEGKHPAGADHDYSEFYDELFARFSQLESKDYVRDVDIVAYNPEGSGEWVTNIRNNEELQDALLGGMTGEMTALSEE